MAAVCRRLHGAFTLVAVHADVPGQLVAARRNSPLVVGVGDGEMFVASDVAAFIAHTREAVELGQDQLVSITAEGYEVTSFTGGERRLPRLPRRLGHRGRREGRLRVLHGQGDRRAADRPSPTPCAATSTAPGSSWTSSVWATRSCAPSTRSSSSAAAPPTTPGCWPSTPSSTGRGCRSRSSWPASSATATRC